MKKDVYELTNPQKSIWYTEQFYKGSSVNTICGTAYINEVVDFKSPVWQLNFSNYQY